MQPTVWTIGHSTRTIDAFIDVLSGHAIELVVDVRRYPGSRRLPHFSAHALEQSLAAASIDYRGLTDLGGRRRPDPDSANAAWRHPAFRAYADYMATSEWAAAMFELMMLAQGLRTAVMCAEVLWWRCHRRMIADALLSLGFTVLHIRDGNDAEPHKLASPARIVGGRLTYEPEQMVLTALRD